MRTPKATSTSDYPPVCRCDGVTHLNEETAGAFGANAETVGVCAPVGSKACSAKCAAGHDCSMQATGFNACLQGMTTETCWGLPATCGTGKGTYRR